MSVFIRTGNGGSDPDFVVSDIGFICQSGSGWTALCSEHTSLGPWGGDGYFTSIEIRDSRDLFLAILAGSLEWSSDGISQSADLFDPDVALVEQLSNNTFDLSDSGRLVLRNVDGYGEIVDPRAGEILFSTDGYFWGYDGYVWERIGTGTTGSQIDSAEYFKLSESETVTGTTTFAPADTTAPALVISPDTVAPTTGLVSGALSIVDGILYLYDATRGKFLSQMRAYPTAGRSGSTTNTYLSINAIATSATGYLVIRPATIISISLITDGAFTWTFEIRKNNVLTPILSLASGGASQTASLVSNVDVSTGDELQFFVNGTAVRSPSGLVELAWRL